MSGYYPESYLRKRQREQGVRRVIFGLIAIGVIAVVGIPLSLFAREHIAALRSHSSEHDPALAREKQQLEQQQRIASTPDQQWAAQPADGEEIKAPLLADLQYTSSFPQLSVALEGGAGVAEAAELPPLLDEGAQLGASALQPVDDAAAGTSPAGTEPALPAAAAAAPDKYQRKDENAEQNSAAGSEGNDKDSSAALDQAAKDKAARDKAAKDKAAKDKAAKEKAQREKAEQLKKEKQRESDKKNNADKPADDPADDKVETPKAGEAVKLLVYAGSFSSSDDAKAAQKSLSDLGLSGSVISDKAGHRLLILSTEDFASADAMLSKLKQSGYGSAYMTRKRK